MSHDFVNYPSTGPDEGIVQDLYPPAASGTPADAVHGSLKRLYDRILGGDATVDTVAILAETPVPDDVNAIYLGGFYVVGDLGNEVSGRLIRCGGPSAIGVYPDASGGFWTPDIGGGVAHASMFGVKNTGDPNDGVANTSCLQTCINFLAAKFPTTAKRVKLPAGNIVINSRLRTTSPNSTDATDGHAIIISFNQVKIEGEGIGKTIITHNAYGGGSFQTNWQVVSDLVFRGSAFFMVPTAGTLTGTTFRNLSISGGFTPTGDNTIQADVNTGDGWDDTFHAIAMANDRSFDDTRFESIECGFYSGELIQGAGVGLGKVFAFDNVLHDTNGDCYSVQAQHQFCRNFLYNCYGNGIDSCQGGFGGNPSLYSENIINNCYIGINIAWLSGYSGIGHLTVRNNTVVACAGSGIAIDGVCNFDVCDNELQDVGTANALFPFQMQTSAGLPLDSFNICRNTIRYVNGGTTNNAFTFIDGHSAGITRGVIQGNSVVLTAEGVANGNTVIGGFLYSDVQTSGPLATKISDYSAFNTTYGRTDLSETTEQLLTTTGTVNLCSRSPDLQNSMYQISVYVRVINAPTDVTIGVNYNDGSGGEYPTIATLTAAAVGPHTIPPYIIVCVNTSGAIAQVYAQAGTANNVYITAKITQVG